jgi:hypothetical protein
MTTGASPIFIQNGLARGLSMVIPRPEHLVIIRPVRQAMKGSSPEIKGRETFAKKGIELLRGNQSQHFIITKQCLVIISLLRLEIRYWH